MSIFRLSKNAKLYWSANSIGVALPTTIANAIQDLDVVIEADEFDATPRGAKGWEMVEPTIRKVTVEFNVPAVKDESFLVALKNAFINGTLLGLMALDSDTDDDGWGVAFDAKVFTFSRSEKLREGLNYRVVMKPCYSATPPKWVKGTTVENE